MLELLGDDRYCPLDEKQAQLVQMGNANAERLLVLMKDEALHMAVVAGERGEARGIVTLENILESIVGDIYNEHQDVSFGEL